MELDAAIAGRRAVRDYAPHSVDERTLNHLIEAAIQAPSAGNRQPWGFVVVRERGILSRISAEVKVNLLATMPPSRESEQIHSRLTDPDFHIFYHAPVLIIISALGEGPWIVEDCALAAQNLMLAAYATGLGSCWIGFAQHFLNTQTGKDILDLPYGWYPVAPIIVGHPASVPPLVARRRPTTHWIG